eukprot:3103399-Prymnesium_polylepis.1
MQRDRAARSMQRDRGPPTTTWAAGQHPSRASADTALEGTPQERVALVVAVSDGGRSIGPPVDAPSHWLPRS